MVASNSRNDDEHWSFDGARRVDSDSHWEIDKSVKGIIVCGMVPRSFAFRVLLVMSLIAVCNVGVFRHEYPIPVVTEMRSDYLSSYLLYIVYSATVPEPEDSVGRGVLCRSPCTPVMIITCPVDSLTFARLVSQCWKNP